MVFVTNVVIVFDLVFQSYSVLFAVLRCGSFGWRVCKMADR